VKEKIQKVREHGREKDRRRRRGTGGGEWGIKGEETERSGSLGRGRRKGKGWGISPPRGYFKGRRLWFK